MVLAKIKNKEKNNPERIETALQLLEAVENGTFENLFLEKFFQGLKEKGLPTDFIQTNNTTEEGALL